MSLFHNTPTIASLVFSRRTASNPEQYVKSVNRIKPYFYKSCHFSTIPTFIKAQRTNSGCVHLA